MAPPSTTIELPVRNAPGEAAVTNAAFVLLPAGCTTQEMLMIFPDESGSP